MSFRIKSFFLFLTIVFLFTFLSSKSVFTPSHVFAQANKEITPQIDVIDELASVKTELDKLEDKNYQSVLRASNDTIEKIDQYTNRLTSLATILGAFLTVVTVFFGINFF